MEDVIGWYSTFLKSVEKETEGRKVRVKAFTLVFTHRKRHDRRHTINLISIVKSALDRLPIRRQEKHGIMYKTGFYEAVMESKDNEAGSDELTDKAAEGRNRINEFCNDYSIRLPQLYRDSQWHTVRRGFERKRGCVAAGMRNHMLSDL
ncbi:hypothetical protein V1477_005083 [Vespula maculifrons]|uniref:Uncharacterized protein n=1 Tax=Vespula maculifrons TaxID=7453 RepID=A0ABD2CNM7_VESMC